MLGRRAMALCSAYTSGERTISYMHSSDSTNIKSVPLVVNFIAEVLFGHMYTAAVICDNSREGQ